MADEDDLRVRVDELEARFEGWAAAGQAEEHEPDTPGRGSRHASIAQVSRRGLLAAAAGAVAGGATSVALAASDDVGGHAHEESGAHDASAISVTPMGDIVSTDVLGALGDLDARLSSLLQFSPDYLQDYACAYDEFFGRSITSGLVGALGWEVAAGDGGTLAPATGSVENMPGWYELSTGSAAANGWCGLHLDEGSLSGHPLFVWEARVAVGPTEGSTPDATWRVGLHDSLGADEPTNGYWFEHRGAGTTVLSRVAKAGAVHEIDSGVRPASSAPYRLRIMSDGGGVAYFWIDDEPVAVVREGLPAESTESFGPVIAIAQTGATGSGRTLRVDYVYLLWSVSR